MDRIIQHIYEDNVPGKLSDSRYLFLNLVFHIHFVKCLNIGYRYLSDKKIPFKIYNKSSDSKLEICV